ncbi:MAG TPA: methyltransferase [Chryseolinea sp.]|nr:methyltransferase [Chryseolinea sp.]
MKSGTYFHFKQFSVRHDRCAMKVGTDAVLLGAWVDVSAAENILDIGTGSGVIALMLAQRTANSTQVESVEIEKNSADQAAENVSKSPWFSRVGVHQLAVQDYFPVARFDLIVTNPPYFNKSLRPPDKGRHQVRHTSSLSYDDLLSAVVRLLTSHGRFNVILPYQEAMVFSELASRYQLFCTRICHFKTRREKPVERTLLEFSTSAQSLDEGEILLYDHDLEWSTSYRSLISDFYIKG